MSTDALAPLHLRLVGSILRAFPPQIRGKARLARALVSRRGRAMPVVLHDKGGNQILLPNTLEPVGFNLWLHGIYEPDVIDFVKKNIRPATVVIDVGANIGAFTIPIAARLRDGGQVIAIEASPRIFPVLKSNIERNRLRNVSVLSCAASMGATSDVQFFEPPMDHFGMGSSAPQFGVSPIRVPARALDSIVNELGIRDVSVIKVDVEGYEAHVFLGAQKLLTGPRPPRIVFEFCDWAEERAFPGKCGWAQEILMQYGYAIWRLSDYLANRAPLKTPLRESSDALVGIPHASN